MGAGAQAAHASWRATATMVYELYKKTHGDRACSYQSYCRKYRDWKIAHGLGITKNANAVRCPGEKLEIDFAGDKIEWVDVDGCIHKSKLFVASMPYSSLLFCEAFEDETQQSWIYGIVDALNYIGGVPEVLVMDNAKALVSHADWYGSEVNIAIRSLCAYYKMQPWPCRVASPRQKNRVEAAVNDTERWVIAQLSLEKMIEASNIDELNKIILRRVDEINDRPFQRRGSGDTRRSLFEREERPLLKALPSLPYEHGEWKKLKVDKQHCIRISSEGGHRYSTPAEYIGKWVFVRISRLHVEIFDENAAVIATHNRCTNQSGEKTHLLPEHLTPQEKAIRRTPRDWGHIYRDCGVDDDLVDELLRRQDGDDFMLRNRRFYGAVYKRVIKKYPPHVINKALTRVLSTGVITCHAIEDLCER